MTVADTAMIILAAAWLIPVVVSIARLIRLEHRERRHRRVQDMANAHATVDWEWLSCETQAELAEIGAFYATLNQQPDPYAWRDPWETRP